MAAEAGHGNPSMLSKPLPPWKIPSSAEAAEDPGEGHGAGRSAAAATVDRDYDVLCVANDTLQAEVRRLRKAIRARAVPMISQADASSQTAPQRPSPARKTVETQTELPTTAATATATAATMTEVVIPSKMMLLPLRRRDAGTRSC